MNKKEIKIRKEIEINKKSARRNYSNQTGITLIALVVTIVVLLILAGVSINAVFSDNGIINRAKDAQNKMDQAKQNDLAGIDELNNVINKWTGESTQGGTTPEDPTTLKSYDKANKKNGILEENAKYTDNERATVTIPKGFKVIADTEGEQKVSKGLVIQDKDGNEFVWVPVNYTATGVDANNNQLDDGFEATFKGSTNNTYYSEPFKYNDGENELTGYPEENSDYMNMMKSVQANKGFYIGRYEAGSVDEDGNNIARTEATTTTSKVVVKRDAYPYIYVGWGNGMDDITTDLTDYSGKVIGKGAVYLSKNMYAANAIGATSCLCYGVQWDAVMNFVADSTHSITNSTNWGNYKNNPWTINRTAAQYLDSATREWKTISSEKTKTEEEGILLTTGASDSFKAKNIFDLAGNVDEWTMEANNSACRVVRGGSYDFLGSGNPASFRYGFDPTFSFLNFIGFRPALYL